MAVLKYKSKDGTWKKLALGSVDPNWGKGQSKVTVKQLTTAPQSIYKET